MGSCHQNHIITMKLEWAGCRCCCGCRWIWWWEEETGAEKWCEAALKWGAREAAAAEADAVADADEGIILVAAGRYKWAAAEGGGSRTSVVVLEEDEDVDEDPLAGSEAEVGVLIAWWCGDCCSMLHDRLHRSHKFIDVMPPPPAPPTTPLKMLLLRRRFSLRSRTWCERCGAEMVGIVIMPCFSLWCWYRLADDVNVRVQPTKQHV